MQNRTKIVSHSDGLYLASWPEHHDPTRGVRLVIGTHDDGGGPLYLGGEDAAWRLSPFEVFPPRLEPMPRTRSNVVACAVLVGDGIAAKALLGAFGGAVPPEPAKHAPTMTEAEHLDAIVAARIDSMPADKLASLLTAKLKK